jgi:hypothetical protein
MNVGRKTRDGVVPGKRPLASVTADRAVEHPWRDPGPLHCGEVEHQIQNLVLNRSAVSNATCCQTPSLATMARNCDHIATMPHVTGRDGCPNRISIMAVDQDQRGHEGMGRTGGDG